MLNKIIQINLIFYWNIKKINNQLMMYSFLYIITAEYIIAEELIDF